MDSSKAETILTKGNQNTKNISNIFMVISVDANQMSFAIDRVSSWGNFGSISYLKQK